MKFHEHDTVPFYSFQVFEPYRSVTNFVTSRNAGDMTDAGNRRRLEARVGAGQDSITRGKQVHGRDVRVVERQHAGEWFDHTDAMVTAELDVPLVVLVADCVIVSLYDSVKNVTGIAHAGWRGTLAGIAPKTVSVMRDTFGCNPADMVAGISPSIGDCCYEVGPEVVDAFYAEYGESAGDLLSNPDFASAGSFQAAVNRDRKFLDLQRANRIQLETAGMRADRIEVAGMCTSCQTDQFFSYRGEDGTTGRFAGLIALNGGNERPY